MSLNEVQIINKSNNPLPTYQTEQSAGMDLHAFCLNPILIKPNQRLLVDTGIYIALPSGFEAQIRPRSGLAFKFGITVVNTPGTIDADYRGEIKVLLINHGTEDFSISNGERIAQMVIQKYEKISWKTVDVLDETIRGTGGYGSSGI